MSDRHAAHMVWPGLRTARLPTLAKHYELMHSSRPNHRATRMSNDYSWLMRKAVFACKEIMCRDPGPNSMYLLAYTRSGRLLLVFSMKYHTETQSGVFGRGEGNKYMIIEKCMKNTSE